MRRELSRRVVIQCLYGGYMDQKVIHTDKEIMGGIPVFVGTRVPFSFLFDYLKSGESLEIFLSDYPSAPQR